MLQRNCAPNLRCHWLVIFYNKPYTTALILILILIFDLLVLKCRQVHISLDQSFSSILKAGWTDIISAVTFTVEIAANFAVIFTFRQ